MNGTMIVNPLGNKCWYNDKDELHREDGPAVECSSGTKYWYIDGKRHREDGPAVEWSDGSKEWYYNGKYIGDSYYRFTQEKFERYLRELKIKEYW